MLEEVMERSLSKVGIEIGGSRPWDIEINNTRLFRRVARDGSLGLGETYMEGWWDCPSLDQFFSRLLTMQLPWIATYNPVAIWTFIKSRLSNQEPRHRVFETGDHYDLGNDLYAAMLGPTMTYSCGYFKGMPTLDVAQTAKFELICRKLELRKGESVLDIGCGWGGLAHHAATNYGARVVGLTVSKKQAALVHERCAGLPVKARLQDYRDVNELFDHVVSVGMFEHVGSKNHRAYMDAVKRCLRPGGVSLLHTIGSVDMLLKASDPWLRKYIFPLGEIPTQRQIEKSTAGLFEIQDTHEFGTYYDLTLMAWHRNFEAAWGNLRPNYEDRVNGQFKRMWDYYLLSCAGMFRARTLHLWQIVLTHPHKRQDYITVR